MPNQRAAIWRRYQDDDIVAVNSISRVLKGTRMVSIFPSFFCFDNVIKVHNGERSPMMPSCQLISDAQKHSDKNKPIFYILRALIQLPRASKLRLICAPSTILFPLFCVLAARSDPAKSIRNSFPTRTC